MSSGVMRSNVLSSDFHIIGTSGLWFVISHKGIKTGVASSSLCPKGLEFCPSNNFDVKDREEKVVAARRNRSLFFC